MSKTDLKIKIEEAVRAEEADQFLNAAFFYRDALKLAVKLGDSQLIKLCKVKVVEMNKKAIESGKDFNEIEVTQEFTKEEQWAIKKIIDSIIKSNDPKTILQVIGVHPIFSMNLKETEDLANKTLPVFYQFGNTSTISDEGHSVSGSSDPKYAWFMDTYGRNQLLILNVYLARLMYKLMFDKNFKTRITLQSMSEYFSNSRIINSENLEIILVGLQKYFEKDYVSAMHILVPQFEALFLSIAQKCGIDIVAVDQNRDIATRTRTLSDYHLDSNVFKAVFGVDFCRQIKFILFEPLGFKIRHKVAHGEISPGECNFTNVTLIIYLYLVLFSHVNFTEE